VGHTDPKFTEYLYTHLFEDDIDNAAVDLSEFLPKSDPENLS
jgi:hypothetical protein